MKKFSHTAVFCASMFLLYSCSKNNNNNTDQLASLGKATISGAVFAKTVDTLGASTAQGAPDSTLIQAWVDTRDFVVNPNPGASYAKRYYSSTVAGGFYTLIVDVSKNQTATVHIEPASFGANVLMKMATPPFGLYTQRKVFSAPPTTQEVFNGSKEARDIVYN